jgi:hypothetical protein
MLLNPQSHQESSVDSPARHGPERNEATRTVLLKNGFEILPGVKYSDRLIIYPQGTAKSILFAQKKLSSHTIFLDQHTKNLFENSCKVESNE